MKRMMLMAAILAVASLAGCESLSEYAATPEGQAAIEGGARTVGRTGGALIGLPPGLGEGLGTVLATGILAVLGARKPKE